MLVHHYLERSAQRTPDVLAIIEPTRSISYGELDRLANRVANLLHLSGVARGDRVVLAMDNCIELVAAYFGTMKAGAVAVPLPGGPKSDRLPRAIVDCSPTAAIVDPATAALAVAQHPLAAVKNVWVLTPDRQTVTSSPSGAGESVREALRYSAETPCAVRSIDLDLAAIIYTSGSTGEPRGVMLQHRNITANTASIVQYLELTAHDRVMCVLPFYYVYGLSLLHTHTAVGGSLVIDNRFVFPNVVLKAMQEQRVTGFAGVPSTFALLLHRSNLDNVPLPDLRYVTQAGGGMPAARITEWLERGPNARFFVMYGATEASARLTYLEPSQLQRKLGSIGRAIPNVEMLVVKDDGTIAAPGETGELVARGSNISPGYWNDPEETRNRFGPLGYRTGDLGYSDEDGYLFLVGRRHDMIKVGAHRVGAKEIEDVLNEFPGVHEVAVVGIPDAILGEVPIAFIAMTADAQSREQELKAFCQGRLPPHKIPSRFVLQRDLPKIPGIGKIDKHTLRRMASKESRPDVGS